MKNFLKILMTIIITAALTFGITMLWVYKGKIPLGQEENIKSSEVVQSFNKDVISAKIEIIKQKIQEVYKGEINEDLMDEYTIKGYVAGLEDVYSTYYTAEEMVKLNEENYGEMVGIGVYITRNEDRGLVEVYKVMKDSPAEKSGIQAGDFIVKIGDNNITAEDFENTSDMIRGKKGTSVKVDILRGDERISLDITRDSVTIQEVDYQMIDEDNKIGYIYIQSFDGSAYNQFKSAYEDLVSKGMSKLVVDVRNDGGGVLTEATQIGDMFSKKDDNLIIQEDKNGNIDTTKAKTEQVITMPVVMITNKYSASASELLTGIVKENGNNTTIIGTKTYGKGVVQTIYPLSDGSAIKLTTAEYFTPNHTQINKKGYTPDEEVKEAEGFTFNGKVNLEKDNQLQRAIEILKTK